MKKKHGLSLCVNKADFVSRIETLGLSIDYFLAEVLVDPTNATIAVAGSIAKGLSTPESDIDLIVIVEKAAQVRSESSSIVFRPKSGLSGLEHKFFHQGVEFDVEIYVMEELSSLEAAVNTLVTVLHQPQSMQTLPILRSDEVKLLDNLRNAWVLSGEPYADLILKRFHVRHLPLYCALFYYTEYLESLEDAFALRDEDARVFCAATRICAGYAVHSMLGIHGVSDPSEKWMWKYVARVTAKSAGNHELIWKHLNDAYFVGLEEAATDRDQVLKRIWNVGHDLVSSLRSIPGAGAVLESLSTRFSYVFDERVIARISAA
ncbi:nucleotidyltransferase domain-containing protein [Rhizobium leguminosarum]|uniref:nucleotidyltransferase domain-containing protein n=1 Tax=Rhizobium leguminosarum TaxID=384 RepID=UPI003F99A27C